MLASGYLFSALIVVPHLLTFPGAFGTANFLGAGLQSAGWLYISWRFGFPAAVICYALLKDGNHAENATQRSTVSEIRLSVIIATGLVCAVTWLVIAGNDYLPRLMLNETKFSPLAHYVSGIDLSVSVAALALLWTRRDSVLDQWLMVAVCALIAELALTVFVLEARFNLGFYTERLFEVVSSTVLLGAMLAELVPLYARHELSQGNLAARLEATQRLQEISTQLVGEEKTEGLYQKIVEAAASIMHSDFASLQMFNPLRGQLRLLASRGFNELAESSWKWVTTETKTTCGAALRMHQRVIVADVEDTPIIVGADRDLHLQNGVHAAQTTPLVSRTGHLVGMISTHWRHPYHPQEQDLISLDVLARQAADLIERSLTEEHTRLLVREVSHRAKNLLAVVQGIVQQTLGEGDSKAWEAALSARLAALAASQDLIVQSDWHGVEIAALIGSQLQHLGALVGTRIRSEGAPLRIAPFAAQTLGMAFYELATNAVKYGALSNATGSVCIQWSLTEASDPVFRLSWQERNGPAVEPRRRHGFGSDVTVQMVEHALDARVVLEYDPLGVSWRVSAPTATVLATTRNGLGNLQSGGDA
jgi:two-component sensor histidine kinase